MMWPFSMIARRRQEKFIREAFASYVPPSDWQPPPPENVTVWFLLVQVRDNAPAAETFKFAEVIDCMIDRELFVWDMMCSVVLATANRAEPFASDEQKIRTIVRDLIEQVGSEMRAVFGRREGWIGNFGSDRRVNFGPMLPRFDELLNALCDTDYGVAREV